MNNVLIFDLETTGLDPDEHRVIEVGHVLWSVEHRMILECYSTLLASDSNDAEVFNAIPPAALSAAQDGAITWEIVSQAAERADCIVAHSAPFDRSFVEREALVEDQRDAIESLLRKPWICTIEDMVWPVSSAYRSLVSVALAHGVAVTSAHRAINDCLLLARLFERVEDIDDRLHLAMQRAIRPKSEFIAKTGYKDKDMVKAAGFHWNGLVWKRYMAVEDAMKLPFDVVDARNLSTD